VSLIREIDFYAKMGSNASGAWMVRIVITLLVFALFSNPVIAQIDEALSSTISATQLSAGCKIYFQKNIKHSDNDSLSSAGFDILSKWMCIGSHEMTIDQYEINGSSPVILTVLFWKHQKAVILVRWSTNSRASDFQGDYYKVYIYDYEKTNDKKPFTRRNDIDEKFGEGWDGILAGRKIVYQYKDAAKIRSRLEKIGY
jgi:hypothetical protein